MRTIEFPSRFISSRSFRMGNRKGAFSLRPSLLLPFHRPHIVRVHARRVIDNQFVSCHLFIAQTACGPSYAATRWRFRSDELFRRFYKQIPLAKRLYYGFRSFFVHLHHVLWKIQQLRTSEGDFSVGTITDFFRSRKHNEKFAMRAYRDNNLITLPCLADYQFTAVFFIQFSLPFRIRWTCIVRNLLKICMDN